MTRTDTIITDATAASTADLCTAMADAFSDYAVPVNLTFSAFSFMMKQRGLSRSASRIAIIDGKVAAIWLVSIRANKSYLISSGTLPAFRGRRLATTLAHACLGHLRETGIESFQTEVLVENTKAASLYRKLGMSKYRDLSCYDVTGRRGSHCEAPDIREISWSEIAANTQVFQDWKPSWQNSNASVTAVADDIRCFCVHRGTMLTGYAALGIGSGNLHQIGVLPDARRQGIGTALINQALAISNGPLRLINIDATDSGFAAFFSSFPLIQSMGQYELMMRL